MHRRDHQSEIATQAGTTWVLQNQNLSQGNIYYVSKHLHCMGHSMRPVNRVNISHIQFISVIMYYYNSAAQERPK
eukprot:scaffold103788_cov91-Attheya_sp.AAC.1